MYIYKSSYPEPHISNQGLFQYLTSRPIPASHPTYIDYLSKRQFTRGQAFDTARRLARGLVEIKGAKQGDTVLIYAKSSIEYAVVVLGCIAAGLIPSLASAAYSPPELAHQIQDSEVSFIFVDPALLPTLIESFKYLKPTVRTRLSVDAPVGLRVTTMLLAPGELTVKGMRGYESLLTKEGLEIIVPEKELKTRTAVMCYSSGTTGLSKGVELTHANMTVVLAQLGRAMSPVNSGKDSMVAILPMYHIYGGVKQIFMPLHEGFSIIVLPKFDLEMFCKANSEYGCTFGLVAPPVLMALSRSPIVEKYDLSKLKWLMTGAAPCGVELTLLFERRFPHTVISQGYGCTELSPGCTILSAEDAKRHRGSVGCLNPGMEGRLVDDEERDVEKGERGELWVRGTNVMKGYLRNPTGTASTITPDGWYKTGDIATITPDGFFFIVDRKKELIKYKGLQVAPGELEALLLEHPEVAEAGIVGVWSEKQQTELPRGYIVPKKGVGAYHAPAHKEKLVQDIHTWMRPKVAHYKRLVGGIVLVDDLPRLPTGKVLRRVLKDRAKAEVEAEPVQARL